MKALALLSALVLSAAAAFAENAQPVPAEPSPPLTLRLDAPAALAPALVGALAGRGVEVVSGDAPADASATVRLLPSAVTRVRSSSGDTPDTEMFALRRATLEVRDGDGRIRHSGTVTAPGTDASVLAAPLADRIADCLAP